MQPDDQPPLSIHFGANMPRDGYTRLIEEILAIPMSTSSIREETLLIGVMQILLDIRDRLPPPSADPGAV